MSSTCSLLPEDGCKVRTSAYSNTSHPQDLILPQCVFPYVFYTEFSAETPFLYSFQCFTLLFSVVLWSNPLFHPVIREQNKTAAKLFCPTPIHTYKITNMYHRGSPTSTCTLEFTLWYRFCYFNLFSDVNHYVKMGPTHQTALLSYGDTALMLLIKVLLHWSCL